jgi:hypothetical protein
MIGVASDVFPMMPAAEAFRVRRRSDGNTQCLIIYLRHDCPIGLSRQGMNARVTSNQYKAQLILQMVEITE